MKAVSSEDARIEWLGRHCHEDTLSLIGEAMCLVVPSVWYEGFPRAILESFAKGTPVIASRLGSMEELVKDKVTGLHFAPGDAGDLVDKVRWCATNEEFAKRARQAARRQFLDRYTGPANYELLMNIYSKATGRPTADLEQCEEGHTPQSAF